MSLLESNIHNKIESLLKKYGFKFWEGDLKRGIPNEDNVFNKTTEDGVWTIEYELPLVKREDSRGFWWDEDRTANYHIYFYPHERNIDKFISVFNKKYKSKFKKKDLATEPGFDLGVGLFNNELEFLMKLERELKKTDKKVSDVFENITLDSIGGMGEVTLPTETEDGSGDVPAGSGDAKKKYKKKMKSFKTFEQFVNENMNLDPIVTNFLDIIQVANNKIELKDVTVEATPKGNWQVYWKGKSLMKVDGKFLNDATIMKYNLEHR